MRSIHSLEDLRKAKKELAIKKKITQQEFISNISTLRNDASTYVVKKVVLPLGVSAAVALAVKFFFFDKHAKAESAATDQESQVHEAKEKVAKNSWLNYFNILLSIIKIYQTSIAKSQAATSQREYFEQSDDPDIPASEPEATTEQVETEPFSPKSFVQQYHQKKSKK